MGRSRPEITINNVEQVFRRKDRVFNCAFDSIENKLCNAIQSHNLETFVKELSDSTHLREFKNQGIQSCRLSAL